MPHSWKIGSELYPHVHWMPTTAGSGYVCWFLEYSWASVNVTYSAPVTISGIQLTNNEQWKHKLCELPEINGSGISGVSSMLICRLYRQPTSTFDTYGDDAGFLEFDIHYQVDTHGSRQKQLNKGSKCLGHSVMGLAQDFILKE